MRAGGAEPTRRQRCFACSRPNGQHIMVPLPCRTRLLENELRVLRDESNRLTHERAGLVERIKENHEKIKLNNQLPYLVGTGCLSRQAARPWGVVREEG